MSCVSACKCVGHTGEPCKMAEYFERQTPVNPGSMFSCGAIWQTRLNNLCSAVVQAVHTIVVATCLVQYEGLFAE